MSWDGKGKSSEFSQSFFVTPAIFAKNYGTHSGISHNFKDAPRSMLGAQICDLWLQDANIETCGGEGGGNKCIKKWWFIWVHVKN
jgi:hypothetical protein